MNVSRLLFKKSGRQSVGRLGLTAAAVALGVFILLALVAGINGMFGQDKRDDWRKMVYLSSQNNQKPIPGVSPLKISLASPGNVNKINNKNIYVTSVYAAGENAVKLPGGLKTPAPQ